MPAQLQIKVDAAGLRKKTEAAGLAFDQTALLRAVGMRQLAWVDENFRSHGRLAGGWKPLSPNTVAGRRGGSSAPLQDTGALRRSFHAGGAGNVFRIGSSEVTVGSSNRVAQYHQKGTSPYTIRPVRAKVLHFMTRAGPQFAMVVHHPGLPARPMLPTAAQARQMAIDLINARAAMINRAR